MVVAVDTAVDVVAAAEAEAVEVLASQRRIRHPSAVADGDEATFISLFPSARFRTQTLRYQIDLTA